MDKVKSYIEANKERFISELFDLLRIPSISAQSEHKPDMTRCAEWLAAALAKAGAPTTIDFQGPNAYNFNFATLIRYEVSFARRHMTFGVAAELPSVSATYGENFKPIHQRVPDFPMYLQYAWGADRSSHLRASAVLRNPYMYKVSKDATTSLFGWGVQLSGTIKCCDWFRMFMNGVYGKGITPYIQDLTGSCRAATRRCACSAARATIRPTSTNRGSISSATSSTRSPRAARWPPSTSTVRART